MVDLEYLSLNKTERFFYSIKKSFKKSTEDIKTAIIELPSKVASGLKNAFSFIPNLIKWFKYGDVYTRLSYLFMGSGSLAHKQFLRGFLYLGYQICFILFMVFFGWQYLSKIGTLGTIEAQKTKYGYVLPGYDNSFYILLFSILTIVVILCTIFLWYKNIQNAYQNYEMTMLNKKLVSGRDDLKELGNKNYHTTLLAFPMLGLFSFTVIPLIFMVIVAFTNFDAAHFPPNKLFGWCGLENFKTLLTTNSAADAEAQLFGTTFKVVLVWTLVWAVLVTFINFILGMVLAIVINKKGIRLKKVWRAILVTTMAVPQFISLLLMKNMLLSGAYQGIYNVILNKLGFDSVAFLADPTIAKVTVIVVDLWIGIPYTVLSTTGILMNIPEDLYEAAKIDGASPFMMFTKITLPYMLFVMGPSLITQFIGNLNNFNVIFLLTSGNKALNDAALHPKATRISLLITWLYDLTVNDMGKKYGLASVIGLIMFIICAIVSLLTFSRSKSFKNEEDFQ